MQNLKTHLFKTKHPSWMLFVIASILAAGISVLILGDGSLVTQVKKLQKQLFKTVSLVSCDESYPEDYFHVCYYSGIDPATGSYLGEEDEEMLGSSVPGRLLAIGHNWGYGTVFPDLSDNISAVWRGRINFPPSRYMLAVEADEGFRLYVNENLVLDEWDSTSNGNATGLELSGYTNIRIEWFDESGNAKLLFGWDSVPTPPGPELVSQIEVDFYILKDVSTCVIGEPCTGDDCLIVYNDDNTPFMQFEKAGLRGVEPSDPRVGTATQSVCLHKVMSDADEARIRGEVEKLMYDLEHHWSFGYIKPNLRVINLTGEAGMAFFGVGGWVPPQMFAKLAAPYHTKTTDFTFASGVIRDNETGRWIAVPQCGSQVGAASGLFGASYSWIPVASQTPIEGIRCALYETYVHEFSNQIFYVMNNLMGLESLYPDESYPVCNTPHSDTYQWFPSVFRAAGGTPADKLCPDQEYTPQDPDSPWCDQGGIEPSCYPTQPENFPFSDAIILAHQTFSHFDFSMQHYDRTNLIGNHCENGIQDFNETDVDSGGSCSPPDTVSPEVTITSPQDGAQIESGATITVTADATDDSGIERVEFFKDGEKFATDYSSPYSASLTITSPVDSSVVLTAVAYDVWENSATSSPVTVIVAQSEPPEVTITSPEDGAIIENCGRVRISATASDLSGIKYVDFWANSQKIARDVTAPYETQWTIPEGVTSAAFVAIAYDNASMFNSAHANVSFISPSPLSVSFVEPQENDVLFGTVEIAVQATGCPGGFEFYAIATATGQRKGLLSVFYTEQTLSFPWNTASGSLSVPNGDYTLETVVYSPDFTYQSTAQISVTINNRYSPCDSYGDVDNDGFITNGDAELVGQHITSFISLSPDQQKRADVDGSREIDSVDALFITQYVQGIRENFPVCIDSDDDGFTDIVENYLGTDPNKACPVTSTPDDEDPDPWPPDFNDDGVVQIDDVSFVAGKFGREVGDPGYTPRAELASQNGTIQIDDVSKISGLFGRSCLP